MAISSNLRYSFTVFNSGILKFFYPEQNAGFTHDVGEEVR